MNSAQPQTVRLAFFGDSIMRGGYVHRLSLGVQLAYPGLRFAVDNRAASGATSRDVLAIVQGFGESSSADLAFLSCGINDVWRGFQGRGPEAVSLKEFGLNYIRMIAALRRSCRQVVCLSQTPFGWDDDCDAAAMNAKLAGYNELARRAADAQGADYADLWPSFLDTAEQFGGVQDGELPAPSKPSNPTLWSDGVHLSELGDALLADLLTQFLVQQQLIPRSAGGSSGGATAHVRGAQPCGVGGEVVRLLL